MINEYMSVLFNQDDDTVTDIFEIGVHHTKLHLYAVFPAAVPMAQACIAYAQRSYGDEQEFGIDLDSFAVDFAKACLSVNIPEFAYAVPLVCGRIVAGEPHDEVTVNNLISDLFLRPKLFERPVVSATAARQVMELVMAHTKIPTRKIALQLVRPATSAENAAIGSRETTFFDDTVLSQPSFKELNRTNPECVSRQGLFMLSRHGLRATRGLEASYDPNAAHYESKRVCWASVELPDVL